MPIFRMLFICIHLIYPMFPCVITNCQIIIYYMYILFSDVVCVVIFFMKIFSIVSFI